MLNDAGVFVLDLLEKLGKIGLALVDSHTHNIAFHKGKFVWIDFGSLYRGKTKVGAFKEFIDHYINSLIMIEKKQIKKYQMYNLNSFCYEDIAGYLKLREKIQYKNKRKNVLDAISKGKITKAVQVLKKWLLLYKPSIEESRWTHYQIEMIEKLKTGDYTKEVITDFIKEKRPKTIFDIGGNEGYYGIFAEKLGLNTIVCDIDEQCINYLYNEIKEQDYKRIIPVVLDILAPTSYMYNGLSTDQAYYVNNSISARQRFKSELVIAKALIHHLVFFQRAKFDTIVRQLKDFTKKYLILQFVHPNDKFVKEWMNESFQWYNLKNLKTSLEKEFTVIECIDETYSRTAIVCELK